eukprot:COSAG02_NODE_56575_length_285_cov_0.451613_1_plen_29_part_01
MTLATLKVLLSHRGPHEDVCGAGADRCDS